MIYSISPFFNEFKLLDLKISEETDEVDQIIIIEADQTFQARPKELLLKDNPKYQDAPKLQLSFLEGQLKEKPSHKFENAAIQKNSFSRFCNFRDNDILLMCDLDEINKKQDIPRIIQEAEKHGLVRLQEVMYYYKLNLCRSHRKGWNAAFACTGKALRELNNDVHYIRARRIKGLGKNISTDGKHFSFLMSPEDIAYKIQNFSHREFMRTRFTDLKEIERRIREQCDPFDRKTSGGHTMRLERCEIDETYPDTILNNLEDWKNHIV